jgi:hypothetical protein
MIAGGRRLMETVEQRCDWYGFFLEKKGIRR